MQSQTTPFLCDEIIRIHDNLFANGRPKYDPAERAEQFEKLAEMAKELAERARGRRSP